MMNAKILALILFCWFDVGWLLLLLLLLSILDFIFIFILIAKAIRYCVILWLIQCSLFPFDIWWLTHVLCFVCYLSEHTQMWMGAQPKRAHARTRVLGKMNIKMEIRKIGEIWTKYNDECVINVYVYHKCQMFTKCDGNKRKKNEKRDVCKAHIVWARTHRCLFTFHLSQSSAPLLEPFHFGFSLEIDENVVSICNVL